MTRVWKKNLSVNSNDKGIDIFNTICRSEFLCFGLHRFDSFLDLAFHVLQAKIYESLKCSITWRIVNWLVLIGSKQFYCGVSWYSILCTCPVICCHINCPNINDSLQNFGSLFVLRGCLFAVSTPRCWIKKKFTIKLNKPKFIRHEDSVLEILFSKFEDRGVFVIEGAGEGEKENWEKEKFKIHCFIRVSWLIIINMVWKWFKLKWKNQFNPVPFLLYSYFIFLIFPNHSASRSSSELKNFFEFFTLSEVNCFRRSFILFFSFISLSDSFENSSL